MGQPPPPNAGAQGSPTQGHRHGPKDLPTVPREEKGVTPTEHLLHAQLHQPLKFIISHPLSISERQNGPLQMSGEETDQTGEKNLTEVQSEEVVGFEPRTLWCQSPPSLYGEVRGISSQECPTPLADFAEEEPC